MDGIDPLRAAINVSFHMASPTALTFEMARQVTAAVEYQIVRLCTKQSNLDKSPWNTPRNSVKTLGWLLTNLFAVIAACAAVNRVTGEVIDGKTVMWIEGVGLLTQFALPVIRCWDSIEFRSPVKYKGKGY